MVGWSKSMRVAGAGSRIRRELPKMTIPAGDPDDRLTPEQKAEFLAQ